MHTLRFSLVQVYVVEVYLGLFGHENMHIYHEFQQLCWHQFLKPSQFLLQFILRLEGHNTSQVNLVDEPKLQ